MRQPHVIVDSLSPVEASVRSNIWNSIWRRKISILAVAIPLTAIAWAILLFMTPRYPSTAHVLIEESWPVISDPQQKHELSPPDQEAVLSRVAVIESTDFAQKAIKQLDLEDELRGRPTTDGPVIAAAKDAVAFIYESILPSPPAMDAILLTEENEAKLVELFRKRLDVHPEGISRVLRITYRDSQPTRAAATANLLAQLYVSWTVETKMASNRAGVAGIEARLATLADQVQNSEDAVASYRRDAGLIQLKDDRLVNQQISELSTQLLTAQRDLSFSRAQLKAVEDAITSGVKVSAVVGPFDDPVLSSLKQKEAQLAQDVQAQRQIYGAKFPALITLQAALEDIRAKLRGEGERLLRNLRNNVASEQQHVNVLNGSLDKLKAESAIQSEALAKLAVLEQKADASRQVFTAFEHEYQRLSAEPSFALPQAHIISRAMPSTTEVTPDLKLLLPLSMIIMLLGSTVVIVFVEALDRTIRSGDHIESWLGIPSLGLIPRVNRRQLVPSGAVGPLVESSFVDSLRNVCVRLLNESVAKPPVTIVLTSALPGEGKTTCARALALLAANSGRRVVLIDADMVRPTLHHHFKTALVPGFSEWLSDTKELSDILRPSSVASVDIISAGVAGRDGVRLFDSSSVGRRFDELRTLYDVIIFDAPPVLAVSYVRMLCALVDTTVLTMRWGKTPRDSAQLALKAILDVGGRVSGGVVCMTNMRRHSRYAYSDSATYDQKLAHYYR